MDNWWTKHSDYILFLQWLVSKLIVLLYPIKQRNIDLVHVSLSNERVGEL